MSDRRRTPRFVLDPPLAANAMPMQDVVVEQIDRDRVTLVSLARYEVGESLMFHVTTSDGLKSERADVLSSTPIYVGASVQYRLELQIHRSAGKDATS